MSRSSYKRQGERRRKALKQKPFNIFDVERKAMKRDGDQTLLPDDMRVVPPSVKLDVTMDPRAARALAIGVPARVVKATLDNEKRERESAPWKPEWKPDGTMKRIPVEVPTVGTLGGGWPTEEMVTAMARAAHDEVFEGMGLFKAMLDKKTGEPRKVKHFDDEGPKVQDRWREIARKIFNAGFPTRPTA